MTDLSQASDAFLVGSIVNGEPDAVGILIERYQKPLVALLRRALVLSADAEDLAQETWIRVVRSAHRYDPTHPFTSWLFAIAWNLIRNHWSAHRDPVDVDLAAMPATGHSAEEQALASAHASMVRDLVSRLPEKLAQAILLRYFEELSEKEMAERLGVPAGTVKSRLHHGLRKLAAAIAKERT